MDLSGRGAVWLAHLHGVQGVAGSNPVAPTFFNFWLFGENVGLLSLCNRKTYVTSTVQTQNFQQFAKSHSSPECTQKECIILGKLFP